MSKPKVFVTQEVTTADYRDVERFGDPVWLCVSEISDVPRSLHNQRLIGLIRERFESYDPAVDYIAPSGSPIISGLVFAIAREKSETFNVLKWNNRDRQYTSIRIGVEGVVGVN